MAINNFTDAKIDEKGALVLGGETLKEPPSLGNPGSMNLGDGAAIQVIVASVDTPNKSCVPVVDNPSATPWSCIAQKDEHDFEPCDRVLAFGAAMSFTEPLFTWVQELTIGPCDKG